jgi:hypothetical protein
MIHAILFGFGTFESPPLAASAFPFASPAGLLCRLFRPVFPVGRERSLKYPSGGVLDEEDMFPTMEFATAIPDFAPSRSFCIPIDPFSLLREFSDGAQLVVENVDIWHPRLCR